MASSVLLSAGSGATIMPTMTVALRDLNAAETPRGTTLPALSQQLAAALGGAVVALALSGSVTARPAGEGGVARMLALDPVSRAAAQPELAVAVGSVYAVPVALLVFSVVAAVALESRTTRVWS